MPKFGMLHAINLGDLMEVLFPTTLKPIADFEVGEIGFFDLGRGAELVMLVIKTEEDLGLARMVSQSDDLFSIHYERKHDSDLGLSYGQDWKLVIDPTGDIKIGVRLSPEIGDIVMWNDVYGLCAFLHHRGPKQGKLNCRLNGTVSDGSGIKAVFRSWKIVLNAIDPETGLAPTIFRHTPKQVSQP